MLRNNFDYIPALSGHDRSSQSHRTAAARPVVRPHEIPEHTAEAASRALTRLVPLVYGVLLGVTGDILAIGLLVGGIGSLAFDLSMDQHSLARPFARQLADVTGRAAASARQRIDALFSRLGI